MKNNIEMQPSVVYLDTEVFIAENFNYKSSKLTKITNYVKDKQIKLIIFLVIYYKF